MAQNKIRTIHILEARCQKHGARYYTVAPNLNHYQERWEKGDDAEDMDRILLIHPDTEGRDQLTSLLEDSGFQVLTAVDAEQAQAEISRREPDVIVMPEPFTRSNGDNPCMRIRAISTVPLIILGEEKQESAGIRFLEAGADVYIASPLNSELLLASIHHLLRSILAK